MNTLKGHLVGSGERFLMNEGHFDQERVVLDISSPSSLWLVGGKVHCE